jgi:Lon protease-like protein
MGTDTELPIFPLSNVVLFPGVQAPLHLFEPRYRQMAEHALATSRRIGMVTVPPEHVAGMEADPPVYPVGCAGVIAQSQRLPDGCYDVVLHGTQRFRIIGELPRGGDRLYRVAEVEPLDDPYPSSQRGHVASLRRSIVELVASLVRQSDPERAEQISPELFRGVDDATFVNSLGAGAAGGREHPDPLRASGGPALLPDRPAGRSRSVASGLRALSISATRNSLI